MKKFDIILLFFGVSVKTASRGIPVVVPILPRVNFQNRIFSENKIISRTDVNLSNGSSYLFIVYVLPTSNFDAYLYF